jgi:hypothetical protein
LDVEWYPFHKCRHDITKDQKTTSQVDPTKRPNAP